MYHISMKKQNQIKRTLTTAEAIEHIIHTLDTQCNLNRSTLANMLCEHFNFFDPSGKQQQSGCLKALRQLEKAGHFTLPAASFSPGPWKPKRPDDPVPEPHQVPVSAEDISELRLVLVGSEEISIWNEIMIQDHPRGAGPLVGRQIRYLIQSEYGLLGGISFSSAALHLDARDKWIGWDWNNRQENLPLQRMIDSISFSHLNSFFPMRLVGGQISMEMICNHLHHPFLARRSERKKSCQQPSDQW